MRPNTLPLCYLYVRSLLGIEPTPNPPESPMYKGIVDDSG